MARSVEDFLVDFSKEEQSEGAGAHYKPGTYKVRIVAAKTGISENKSTPYLELTMAFKEGTYAKRKKKIKERLYNTPKAMRRFRLLLQAVDLSVPAKLNLTKIAPKLKGKELYVEIDDEPAREGYEDRGPRSRVAFEGFISEEDYDPDVDEDEEDDEDLEEEDEEDEEEDEDEDEDDEEDEDEEEEPPARKRRAKAKAKSSSKKSSSKKRKAKSKDDDDDEDLDDLDLDEM